MVARPWIAIWAMPTVGAHRPCRVFRDESRWARILRIRLERGLDGEKRRRPTSRLDVLRRIRTVSFALRTLSIATMAAGSVEPPSGLLTPHVARDKSCQGRASSDESPRVLCLQEHCGDTSFETAMTDLGDRQQALLGMPQVKLHFPVVLRLSHAHHRFAKALSISPSNEKHVPMYCLRPGQLQRIIDCIEQAAEWSTWSRWPTSSRRSSVDCS